MKPTKAMAAYLREHHNAPAVIGDASDETLQNVYGKKAAKLLATGELSADKFRELSGGKKMSATLSPETLFDQGSRIRVKDESEKYDETRYAVKHVKTGQPVVDPIHERECMSMSEGSKARAGVLLKFLANKAGVNCPLGEHERSLLDEVCVKQAWAGKVGDQFCDYIGGDLNIKALIDDAGSGGLEITPIEFDSDVITFPLLGGELFPMVDLKVVPRGRRIEGASIGTPTMSWGGGDDTAITVFNTAAIVNPIDTTIFTIDGAIEVGRDFLSDSPVNVGGTLTGLVGDRLRNELDNMIADGNGTTQPQGIFTAAGVGTVLAANAGAGPPTLADYVGLLFGLAKQYRNRSNRVAFVTNDTTYQRSRQIAIDTAAPTTDQRPALAPLTTINDYECLGWPHKIENNITNRRAAIVAMAKYRMYRRLGLEIRFETGGSYLATRNLALLVYRARFGGRLMDANACCKWTNGQS